MRDAQAEAYSRWYERNKEALSEKRKKRYREDPEYRAACLARKALQTKEQTSEPVPEQYVMNLTDTAEALDVSLWKLRSWREKGYYPEPYTHARGVYFTTAQFNAVASLRDFFDENAGVMTEDVSLKLQGLTDLIRANW